MFSQSGKKILLCCILAGITGCSDVVVSISGTNNESVCVDNTVYTLHSTDDGSTLSNRYCSTCNNGLCQVCTPGENTCYNVNRNNMKFSYREECDENGQYKKLACNDIPECKDDKGVFLDGCERKPECVNPEFHCENNASCNKDKTDCGVCRNGDIQCTNPKESTKYEICVDGAFVNSNGAGTPYECSNGNCYLDENNKPKCPECSDDANRCTGGSTVQHCVNGAWGSEESCDADNICVQGECKPKCEIEGKTQCMGNAIYTCNGTTWNETPERTCDEGEICINNETCGCINGETDNIRLFEGKKQKCVDNKWVNIETICNPGTQKCSDDYIYKCDETGQWENAPTEHCEFGCSFREGECRQVECITDGPLCVDNLLFECNDSKPSYIANCAKDGICDAEQNKCIPCNENELKCENNKQYTCVNGQWSNKESCPDNATCNDAGTDCGDCKDGTKKCVNGKEYTCSNGNWESVTDCPNDACNSAGTECSECENGTSTCLHINPNGTDIGILTTCENGIRNTRHCEDDNSCQSKSKCGVCQNGSKKCENGKEYTCLNGNWGNETACLDNFSCNSAGTECGECENNKIQCNSTNNALMKCKKGNWETIEDNCDCKHDDSTNQDKCYPIAIEQTTCAEDQRKCQDGILSNCINNTWVDHTCDNNASCRSATECGDCIDGSTECSNGKLRTCTNGVWDTGKTCENGASCKLDNTCGDCKDGSTECSNGKLRTCNEGAWSQKPCDDNASCSTNTTCGECKNGSKKCENGKEYTCSDGDWGIGTACPNDASCNSEGTECVRCTENAKQCSPNANKVEMCSSGSWTTITECYGKQECGLHNGAYTCILNPGELCFIDRGSKYIINLAININDPRDIGLVSAGDCAINEGNYVIIDVSPSCIASFKGSITMKDCMNDCFDGNQIKESCPEKCKIYPCPTGQWP